MDINQIVEKWKDKPEPKPEEYGFVPATSPEDKVGNWTVEGGEAKYYEDLGHWNEAQEEVAFQQEMKELETGSDETTIFDSDE